MDNEKPTEEELNAWIEKVHFGSCCSDPLETPGLLEQTKSAQTEQERSDT